MSGSPFKLVRETLKFIVNNLNKGDRFSVVTFGDTVGFQSFDIEFSDFPFASQVDVDLNLTEMNDSGKAHALKCVTGLRIEGCTFLCGGLVQGLLYQHIYHQ